MSSDEDLMQLDDPAFLAERTRMGQELDQLVDRYRRLNQEFDRRTRAAWTATS